MVIALIHHNQSIAKPAEHIVCLLLRWHYSHISHVLVDSFHLDIVGITSANMSDRRTSSCQAFLTRSICVGDTRVSKA